VRRKILSRLIASCVIATFSITSLGQTPAGATRTIEEAANSLLTEALSSLELQITNQELLLELSYEIQYALDTGIIEQDTIDELDIEVLNEEIPDEDLFEEDVPQSPVTTSTPQTSAQLSEELKLRLQTRFTERLNRQLQYWEIVSTDWATASELATQEFEKCITAATSDEESDVCYFNELQQLQVFYGQQLANNYTTRLSAATSIGTELVALLTQSLEKAKVMVQETLSFMSAEELASLGFTTAILEDIALKLGGSTTQPNGPANSNPQGGSNP
jgi:hypothetical protein